MIRKILSDKQYLWLLRNLPFKFMYKKIFLDETKTSTAWVPRWGYPKYKPKERDLDYDKIMWDDCDIDE